jgi:hypothetical protein
VSLLTEAERTEAARQVRALILAAGQQATLVRAVAGGEGLYGTDDETFEEVGDFALELLPTPPEDLARSIDATAAVLPDFDVRPEDRVRCEAGEFRVQTVRDERLFGVVTHRVLELVRIHGG